MYLIVGRPGRPISFLATHPQELVDRVFSDPAVLHAAGFYLLRGARLALGRESRAAGASKSTVPFLTSSFTTGFTNYYHPPRCGILRYGGQAHDERVEVRPLSNLRCPA